MTEAAHNFEGLLREALAPVDPPADLVERLEGTLMSITEMAADELEAWELSAMRDPRNWVRPAAAVVLGSTSPAPAAFSTACASPRSTRPPSAPCATSLARRANCSATAERRRGSGPGRVSFKLRSLPDMATCYRHPSRETGVSCSNCGRPICPDCMTTTPVGMRCPECSKQRTKVVPMRGVAKVARVTYALIAINVVAFLTEQGQFTVLGSGIYGKVIDEGVLFREAIGHGNDQYWRLLTSGFLHENFIHIGFNMYLLYLLGMMLEPAIGSVRFTIIYFTSLLIGSFGVVFSTNAPSLGASGAIFGLMGAAVVELRSRGISVQQSGIGGLIVINLIFSFTFANISIGAHIGGLIGGFLAGMAIRTADNRRVPALGMIACVVLAAAAVFASIAVSGATGSGFA